MSAPTPFALSLARQDALDPIAFTFSRRRGQKSWTYAFCRPSNPIHVTRSLQTCLCFSRSHGPALTPRSMGNVPKISVPFQSLVRNFKSDDIVPETISREAHARRESGERCYIARKRYLSSLVPSGECRMPLSLSRERGGREGGMRMRRWHLHFSSGAINFRKGASMNDLRTERKAGQRF